MMREILSFTFAFLLSLSFCITPQSNPSQSNLSKTNVDDSIIRVDMHLSAFGVESDDFPSIDCYIDFKNDSSRCFKSYYNPAHKPSTYRLSQIEMKKVLRLLQDVKKLKTNYAVSLPDQPTSTITIYLGQQTITIKDYGLNGEYPLQELYKIVYKY
jgi:hypothetical protein